MQILDEARQAQVEDVERVARSNFGDVTKNTKKYLTSAWSMCSKGIESLCPQLFLCSSGRPEKDDLDKASIGTSSASDNNSNCPDGSGTSSSTSMPYSSESMNSVVVNSLHAENVMLSEEEISASGDSWLLLSTNECDPLISKSDHNGHVRQRVFGPKVAVDGHI